jgi:glycosyltransferase involved in cell wall biosynthesis
VIFLGEVDGGDKTALLHHAVALVLPSYSENFGNVVLEAMAAGRPVVVTPEVGLAEVVEAERAGWVVPGDPGALGVALKGVLADPEQGAQRGANGARAARRRFTWPAVAEQMERFYLGSEG